MAILAEQFDPKLRQNISKKPHVAIIPVGSIEQHGGHLPLSTDSDIVTEISRRISKKNNYLLLPTVSFGVSYEHAPFFNLSISGKTLNRILADLVESLYQNGIKTVFVINGHHGNQKSLNQLEKKIKKILGKKIRVFVFSYWHFMKRRFDHAGFVETSLMLSISDNIDMKKAKKGLIEEEFSQKQIQKISKLASKSFPKATKNGIWGDPTKANAKDGQKILTEIVTNLQKKCQTCLTGDRPKLHK